MDGMRTIKFPHIRTTLMLERAQAAYRRRRNLEGNRVHEGFALENPAACGARL